MHIHHEIIERNYTVNKLHREWGFDHWHHKVEFAYILEGTCQIRIAGSSYVCKTGDLAVIHSGEIHSIKDISNSVMYICTFDPEMLYYFTSAPKLIRNYISSESMAEAGIYEDIRRHFEEIFAENASRYALHDVLIKANIVHIYALLARSFTRKEEEKSQNLAKVRNFQEALLYIRENYAGNITLTDVAKHINYNTSYVSSLFVAYTGLNFKTYLDSIRVNKAVQLMKSTERTLSDISAQCGFANIRTFNNVFRKITGLTPSQVRTSAL